ncbi:hypothetical protein AMATHDRAFT_144702 [Amanita thiersii Skay4041]|uniref:Uncharacterized protein n=1 Tax=Amanita thiersii Skay4041 TaxID=703135 RepID=A0A2A9NSG8_9AGAR|nr:hypothetical protein AMATHDRAFT_144702 [Amanita thiersii Skay4041]
MPSVISNATRIWEVNVHWKRDSQCSVWNSKLRGVDIWQCIRDHDSTPDTEPPNSNYWIYVARR